MTRQQAGRRVARLTLHRFRAEVASRDLSRLDGVRARAVVSVLFAAGPAVVDRRRARRLDGAVEWRITRPDGDASLRTMTFADGRCRARRGAVADPDVTLQLSLADLLALAAGTTDGVTLVFAGRLRISGDIGLAMRLPRVFRIG